LLWLNERLGTASCSALAELENCLPDEIYLLSAITNLNLHPTNSFTLSNPLSLHCITSSL
jgi:hypothetical protein